MDGLIYSAFYAAIPLAALVIDTIYGDPRSDYHPVVLIGKVISFFEGKLYPEKKTSDGNMFFRGMMTSLLVLLTVGLVVGFLTWLSVKAGILMYAAVSAVVLYFTITPRHGNLRPPENGGHGIRQETAQLDRWPGYGKSG